MLYIATNIDSIYYHKKHDDWVKSVNKYKPHDAVTLMFQMGFEQSIPDIETVSIPYENIKYSRHTNLKNRPNFVCLESGEFVNFKNFNDNDVLILCDWDVTMQREFTNVELELIDNLGEFEFGMNLDNYVGATLHSTQYKNLSKGYLGILNIFNDVSSSWQIYNTGIQAAKISAWRNLCAIWQELCDEVYMKCDHHAAGQMLFNYIANKHSLIKEMPLTFHNAHWFTGTPTTVKGNKLHVGEDLVLFNHHKWGYRPGF